MARTARRSSPPMTRGGRGLLAGGICLLALALPPPSAPGAGGQVQYMVLDLGALGGEYSEGNGINKAGRVVGVEEVGYGPAGDSFSRAFRTAPNAPINPQTDDLGTFGGYHSVAYGINDAGQVVGWSNTADDPGGWIYTHAFRTAP